MDLVSVWTQFIVVHNTEMQFSVLGSPTPMLDLTVLKQDIKVSHMNSPVLIALPY